MLEKINKLTRRPLTEDEIYVFSVMLCDNDIDRDGECFSDKSLEQIAELFVGKAGAFDHTSSSSNQTARIFDTEIITDDSRLTKNGELYKYVKASVYMVRTDENRSLISEIDGGIKKEVSISCSVVKRVCSICGCNKNKGNCSHEKWKSYGGKQCYITLDDITDAYEWSFVSVPIQTGKGVKRFKEDNKIMNHEILFKGKRVDNGEWIEGFYAECKDGAFITQKSVGKMGSGFQTTWVGGETQTTNYCILGRFYEVVPETVGRYTGMTDKNGVKIFEGDILRFRSGDYVVEWCNEHSKFLQADKEFSRGLYICIDESEVVGNIHDGGIEI